MRFPARLIAALAFAAALTSCGPSYFLTMRPVRGSGVWSDGSETVHEQQDSVDVRINFIRYDADRLVFDVDFRNISRRALTVGPTDFYFQPVATQPVASTVAASQLPGRLAAFDPEPQIQNLTRRVAEESAAATHVSGGELLTGLSHVVEDLASIKKKETKEQEEAREARQNDENAYYTRQRLEAAAAADQHRAQLEELRSQALRRNTVDPGQRLRGYVFFPRLDQADLLRISAPGLREGTTLDFTQLRARQP